MAKGQRKPKPKPGGQAARAAQPTSAGRTDAREPDREERSAEPTEDRAIRPPGRIEYGRHGPQSAVPASSPIDSLRNVLGLSGACSEGQVLDDAVAEIERLRPLEQPEDPCEY